VRIDLNRAIETNTPQGTPLTGATPEQAAALVQGGNAAPSPALQPEADARSMTSVGPSELPYVKGALATGDINDQAVQEARQLLQSGELDTPEAAGRAAKAMIDFGL